MGLQVCSIVNESSIDKAISIALKNASIIGFDKLNCNLIISAVSEIATNIIRYAGEGKMLVEVSENKRGIQITFSDKGSGIDNIDEVMIDGHTSSKSSLGVGLGATKRVMDSFKIESKKGHGTIVTICKWLPISEKKFQYGVVSLSDPNYLINGDGYLIHKYEGDSILVAIVDGLGQGEPAWKSTELTLKTIKKNHLEPLETIIKKCDKEIRNKYPESGVAMGLLRIEPEKLTLCGVGDTFLKIYSSQNEYFTNQQGVVGAFRLPRIITTEIKNIHNSVIVLCTDGISNHIDKKLLNLSHHPHHIAESIFKNYRKVYGDATVLVVKLN